MEALLVNTAIRFNATNGRYDLTGMIGGFDPAKPNGRPKRTSPTAVMNKCCTNEIVLDDFGASLIDG